MKRLPIRTNADCRREFDRMLKNSQTKVIMPAVGFGLLRSYLKKRQVEFQDSEIKAAYQDAVRLLKKHIGHDLHIGGKYEDAYGMRMSRYGFLSSRGHLRYELNSVFRAHAKALSDWLPGRIKEHIDGRIGVIPSFADPTKRLTIAGDEARFISIVCQQLDLNPASFEIVSFALLKVHLERFACRIYRDTRTSSHDHGVDLATNFGVVYQVKKLRVHSRSDADRLYAELKLNFDQERLQDGNVILVIDDIAEDVRRYLVDMKVQSIKRDHLLAIARGFEDAEDRQKVLRVIFEEFRREYSSAVR